MTISIIHKNIINQGPFHSLSVPKGAEFLHVAEQYGELAIWYRCDPTKTLMEVRELEIYGTGHTIKDNEPGGKLAYIGTVMMAGGTLVWHVFERVAVEG